MILLAADRFRVDQGVVYLKAIARLDAKKLARLRVSDTVGPVYAQLLDGLVLFGNLSALQQLTEFHRRAIKNRELSLHFHQQIGDPVPMESRHQVLNRLRHYPITTEAGRVPGGMHVLDRRWNRDLRREGVEDNATPWR